MLLSSPPRPPRIVLALALLAGAAIPAAVLLAGAATPAPARAAAPAAAPNPVVNGTVADVAERSVESVVNISSTRVLRSPGGQHPLLQDPFFRHFFGPRTPHGMPRERRQRALGSGVIVGADGVVLTNNHVVAQADEIRVMLAHSEEEYEAEVVGTDPKSDVAVLRLKGKLPKLVPLPIGDSGALRLGDPVLAVGNPFGLSHTVTMGIVSAKGRANVGLVDYEDFIQTDAAINPGNSGGALVNLRGELVGINTAIASRTGGYQGVGFAIPSNMARAVMDSLLEHGKVIRGWLGVMIQDVDRDLAEALELPDARGVVISDVVEDSPAARAGVQRGDVVRKVNGERVDTTGRLRNVIAGLGARAVVRLDVLREGKQRQVKVALGELPDELAGAGGAAAPDDGLLAGVEVEGLSRSARERHDVPASVRQGVVVTGLQHGTAAASAGLRPGDVLLEIDRQTVGSVTDFREAARRAKERVLLLVYREGRTFYLILR